MRPKKRRTRMTFPSTDPGSVPAKDDIRALATKEALAAFELLEEDRTDIDLEARRAASELRQPLETRVRRQANSYADRRRRDLQEMIVLAAVALAPLEDE
jgi:hypothetical protein